MKREEVFFLPKKSKYKRKFRVPGDTIKTCWDFREKCSKTYGDVFDEGRLPCEVKIPTAKKTFTGGNYIWRRDESRCPFPINQPNYYIVSELNDGTWQCSCPAWKFRRKECRHIQKAKANPEKYEIAVEFTGKLTNAFSKIFNSKAES